MVNDDIRQQGRCPEKIPDILLKLDTGRFIQVLEEARALLDGLIDPPEEIVDSFVDLLKSRVELFAINQLSAIGARELRFGLDPSNRLLELLAALRAVNGKRRIGIEA